MKTNHLIIQRRVLQTAAAATGVVSNSEVTAVKSSSFGLLSLLVTLFIAADSWAGPADFTALVGQPADIAPSAYLYRADRKPAENAPESWLALMRYAHQPLNQPADVNAPAIKRVLCALLWE